MLRIVMLEGHKGTVVLLGLIFICFFLFIYFFKTDPLCSDQII